MTDHGDTMVTSRVNLVQPDDPGNIKLGATDYVVIVFMLLLSSSIGIYFRFSGGKQKTTHEFLMAGRNMSVFPVALSIMASGKSAITYLGVPADMYVYGTHFAFVSLGTAAGAFVAGYLFLPVFFSTNSSTAYEYLEKRFGRYLRIICSFSFSLQVILYIAVCLYAPALALSAVTSFSLWTSIITVGAVCTFYCTLGGMKAVLWTDVFQAFLMYSGILAMVIKGTMDVGGLDTVLSRARDGERLVVPKFEIGVTTRYTFINIFMNGFITALSAYGASQMQVQRLLTVSSVRKARCALYSSIPITLFFTMMNCFVGLVVYANFFNCDPLTSGEKIISSPDQLLPYFSLRSLGHLPGVAGLCVCGMLSAALSTMSSMINSLTTVTVEDFMKPYLGLSEGKSAWAAMIITICYGVIGLLLTYIVSSIGHVLQSSTIVYGLVAGPTLGVFLLGILTSRTNEKGAIIGLLTSLVFTAWISFGGASTNIGHPKLPVSTSGCHVGNLSSVLHSENSTVPVLLHSTQTPMADISKDIFPLYRISYMWFTFIGTATTVIVGYLSSYFFSKPPSIEDHLLNPIVRKLCFNKEEKKINVELKALATIPNGVTYKAEKEALSL